ncbi:MAG TPA: sugar ABC transporter ATP-binding protein [Propylenella sp.]|nr:sugar ABC transporter ATP-binding protein [Propylenella sp.]
MGDLLLSMRGIDKAFAGVPALVAADLAVARGEVHALIGQNGAGKSTLIKILTGAYRRDGGEILFDGKPVSFASPRSAQEAGISTIYQEINLVPLRSVTENVCLGYEPRRAGLIDWRAAHRRTREILARFGVDIDVTRRLGEYNTAIQQMVAIARAVSLEAKLVVMDEPTSSLDDREVEILFNVIRELKSSGVAIIYVSHYLDELFQVCDRVTVMRDGRTIETQDIAQARKLNLIAAMLGRRVEDIEAAGMTDFSAGEARVGETMLEVEHLATGPKLRDVSLILHRGEIVGLAGLLGSGRTEVARAVFGIDSAVAGSVRVTGRAAQVDDPREAVRAGLGFLTEDRKADGIVPELSVRENLTLALLPRLTRAGRIREGEERKIVERFIQALGIKTSGMEQPVRELSGGNQQKVLLARWLATEPRLLILDEPTRGVDVGAKREIQNIIRELADKGLAVLMISSEFEELVEGADRVVVLREGVSVAEFRNPGITEDALVSAIAQHREAAAA